MRTVLTLSAAAVGSIIAVWNLYIAPGMGISEMNGGETIAVSPIGTKENPYTTLTNIEYHSQCPVSGGPHMWKHIQGWFTQGTRLYYDFEIAKCSLCGGTIVG